MAPQKRNDTPKEAITAESFSLITTEYNAMREEILKLEENQHQILSLSLIAPGTILAIGFQTRNASIMYLYPILALFLAAIWLSNSHGVHRIATYIKNRIEAKVGIDNIGWEHFHAETIEPYQFIGFLGFRAIFIVTELLAIVAGISLSRFNAIEILFLIVAITSCILTILILTVFDLRRARHKNLQLF
jgi:hypothetical protein